MEQSSKKISIFHPEGVKDRESNPEMYQDFKIKKAVFDSVDYFQAQQKEIQKMQQEKEKDQIIEQAEKQQVEEITQKYKKKQPSQKFFLKFSSKINKKKKTTFDSADFFISQQKTQQKNKQKNDVSNESIELLVEQQSEQCELKHICNKMDEKYVAKCLINKKKQAQKFDSADYFIEKEKNNQSIKSGNDLDDVEICVEKQSEKLEKNHILSQKTVINNNCKKKIVFDSADYWVDYHQNQNQEKKNQNEEPNNNSRPNKSINVKKYNSPLFSNVEQKPKIFDSAEYFLEQQQKLNNNNNNKK